MCDWEVLIAVSPVTYNTPTLAIDTHHTLVYRPVQPETRLSGAETVDYRLSVSDDWYRQQPGQDLDNTPDEVVPHRDSTFKQKQKVTKEASSHDHKRRSTLSDIFSSSPSPSSSERERPSSVNMSWSISTPTLSSAELVHSAGLHGLHSSPSESSAVEDADFEQLMVCCSTAILCSRRDTDEALI